MQRKHFDVLISTAGLILAVVLLVFGLYLKDQRDFANNTVSDQLSQQKINFKPAEALTDEEKEQPGLVKYAGEAVDNGDKARVYADEFIGLHLKATGEDESLWGLTYAELGNLQRQDPPPDNIEAINETRETVFKGETLRGLLLTTYGFWQLGQEAEFAMTISFIGAALLFLFALLGYLHALRTPKDATI
ncbi:MAG TPA: hypothetical protein VFZ83_10135 [Acidimicrobiia bacterium]|nr:hypothetical protein [Acidimicrobiia bacterium]